MCEVAYAAARRDPAVPADIVDFLWFVYNADTPLIKTKLNLWYVLKLRNNGGVVNVSKAELIDKASPMCWHKLYRREFIQQHNIQFNDVYALDDGVFVYSALLLAENILSVKDRLMYYRRGAGVMATLDYSRAVRSTVSNWRALRARFADTPYISIVEPRSLRTVCNFTRSEADYAYVRDEVFPELGAYDMAGTAADMARDMRGLTYAEFLAKYYDITA
ncbi:hypothetical protein FACS1894133_2800 [Clostridia bacterium]|nr:hypothetical protein FACS1894133_2800 [Clostridia bacterium]